MRAEASDKAEMVNQMLYGEYCELMEENGSFVKIKLLYDGYEGWADPKHIEVLSEAAKRKKYPVRQPFISVMCRERKQLLSIGAETDRELSGHRQNGREAIIQTAKAFLNVPYLWGGKSFFGTDCSGFIQLVCKAHDIWIPRDAWQQAEKGKTLDFLAEIQPGDLAFFSNDAGRIVHVGMMLSQDEIIHAHGAVRTDMLDSRGIFNVQKNKYTHKLAFVKNILDASGNGH